MNLSKPFIRRPIGTTLLAIGIALAGMVAFKILPVSPLPQVDFPTINVQASLPGASPDIMAATVATPLERQLGVISGVTEMTSASTLGSSNVTLQFDLSRNIDGAARDVQAAINAASSSLPTNLPTHPTYRKINPADSPIMVIAVTSDHYTKGEMYDAASTILQQKLSQIFGVGQVTVGGSSLPAVRVELNPTALNKYGISLSAVRNVITKANANSPKGQLVQDGTLSQLKTNDQISKAYQYKPLIIFYNNGLPVRLADVGSVVDSVQDLRNAGIANNKPAVLLILYRQPNANIIETVDRVNAALPYLKATIPAGMDLTVMMDRTETIRASLHDVELTLLIAIALVILVVYFFLGSWQAMFIPGVALSLSLLGTFGIMALLGFSLDNLSLIALTISTGFVVDDAIVVLENATRHIEAGEPPMLAALHGAQEVGFTVVSMSLSLIAVFTPILLMGGIVGRLFREFAVTLSVAILISMVISLTVTPMMCSQFLKKKSSQQMQNHSHGGFYTKMHEKYENSLRWALDHSRWMVLVTLIAILLNIILFYIVPKGFFPQQDTGRIMSSILADQNISFQSMETKLADYIRIIKNDPAVKNVAGIIGGSNTNTGRVFILLKPLSMRKLSVDEVMSRLRKKVSVVQGATLYMQAAQDLVIGGRLGNAQFQYTLTGENLKDLNSWAPRVQKSIANLPGVVDMNSDQQDHGLQAYVNVDNDTALRFGITSQLIDQTLYSAFGQSLVSTIYTPMNQYYVVMEVAPQYWQQPETLNDIYVNSISGKQVPLAVFSHFILSSTLLSVNHQSQAPSATFSFNLLPGHALGDAVNAITNAVNQMHLPPTIHGAFQGTAQAFQTSLANEPFLILIALVAVYIVLGILYESYIHPITILSTLPSAGVGAILALLLTRTDLSIIALIGMILLIGIVKKNAIMMIDFALNEERINKKSSKDAIYEAALLRFRPIMMTTLAAMFGAVPLAIGFGTGAELRRPLGIAIIGGLIVSQMLTLYTTPVIYLEFERLRLWLNARKRKFRIVSARNL